MIHSETNLPPGQDSVTLNIIVDTLGNIESAKATVGPKDFFTQAETLEAKRTFKPFLRNGLPVRATFKITSPSCRSSNGSNPRSHFPKSKIGPH